MLRNRILLAVLAAALATAPAGAQEWRQVATPADAGFSAEGLAAVRAYADSVRSAAVLAVHRGQVIVAWGDVARRIPAHSVRKSLVSALYGASGITLDATLGELGIDDDAGLTATEKSARVRDILAARSGVYLPAAYAPADQDSARPARGSHAPGTHWFYNNWDFNVAGVIYERVTGMDVYEGFDSLIARPIGMEDYSPADGFVVLEPGSSRHPAHTFAVSARDLARFGQLYLQEGRWQGRQVIPAAWVRESTTAHSDFGNGTGYGYMWWTYASGSLGASYPTLDRYDLYMGRGTGGQAIIVVPGAEFVFTHRGDTGNGRPVSGAHAWAIAERILATREGEPDPSPATIPLTASPFASQLPEPSLPRFLSLERAVLELLTGSYEVAPGNVVRVFLHDGRPFIAVPGHGEAEMFALSEEEFTIRVQAGVGIFFERDAAGSITGIVLTLGRDRIRGRKL